MKEERKKQLEELYAAKVQAKAEEISKWIYEHPEDGDQEFLSSAYICEQLKETGFSVQLPYGSLKTAFRCELKGSSREQPMHFWQNMMPCQGMVSSTMSLHMPVDTTGSERYVRVWGSCLHRCRRNWRVPLLLWEPLQRKQPVENVCLLRKVHLMMWILLFSCIWVQKIMHMSLHLPWTL